jgi:hypothetical protein
MSSRSRGYSIGKKTLTCQCIETCDVALWKRNSTTHHFQKIDTESHGHKYDSILHAPISSREATQTLHHRMPARFEECHDASTLCLSKLFSPLEMKRQRAARSQLLFKLVASRNPSYCCVRWRPLAWSEATLLRGSPRILYRESIFPELSMKIGA